MDDFIPSMTNVFDGLIITPSRTKNLKADACFCHTDQPKISFSSIFYGQQTHAAYEIPKGVHIISVITQGRACYSWNHKRSVSHSRINFLPHDALVDMEFSPDCCQLLIAVPASGYIGETFNLLHTAAMHDESLKFRINHLAYRLSFSTHFSKSIAHSERLMHEFYTCLLDVLLNYDNAWTSLSKARNQGCPIKQKSVLSTIEFIHDTNDWAYDIEQLASISNMSTRSFFSHFKSHTGLTPYHYYINVNLNRVRLSLLKNKDKGLSISELAMANGFTHLSRFSSQYRTLFGELPSETKNNR